MSILCFFLHLCWMYRPTGSAGSVILSWANGQALAVTCKWSNLHPVLIHVLLFCVQCDHPLSFVYTRAVLFTASVYLLLYHVSSLSPNLPLAIQLGLFVHLQNLNSWFLYQIILVARHMLYWHAQDNLASQILASFPGSHVAPRTRASLGTRLHKPWIHYMHQENKSPCIYLQRLTFDRDSFKSV